MKRFMIVLLCLLLCGCAPGITEKSVETELRYAADGTYQGKSVYTISGYAKPAREEVYNAADEKICTRLWLYGTYRRTEYGTNEKTEPTQ